MKNLPRLGLFLGLGFRCGFVLALALATSATTFGGFVERTVELDEQSYAYTVYVPEDWTPDETWPVVLFLHGAGESGSDGVQQMRRGLPQRIRELGDFPAVVVMPQCRRGTWWGSPEMEAQTFRALDAAMKEFRGDPERVYLTGLSLGGYGTWAFGYKYPDRFAALAPVCGGVSPGRRIPAPAWHPAAVSPQDPYSEAARGIHAPVWAFHGDADRTVPVTESRRMTDALKQAGKSVRYTEYPGVGHSSWDQAYWEDELVSWLLAQRKK